MEKQAINRIWVLLMGCTLVTYILGESGWAGQHGRIALGVMFLLAFVKAFLVAYDFMELRHAPSLWRRLVLGWLVLVISAIVAAYWLAR